MEYNANLGVYENKLIVDGVTISTKVVAVVGGTAKDTRHLQLVGPQQGGFQVVTRAELNITTTDGALLNKAHEVHAKFLAGVVL